MGIYQFKEQDIKDFAQHMGIRYKLHGDEYIFKTCPYCKGGRNHDVDKFAINRNTGAFNCMRSSCGAKGNMLTLAKDFDFSLGAITDEYYRPRKSYRTFKKPDKPYVPKEPAVKYLESRGISEEIAKRYEITTLADHTNILVFPFYDEKGNLIFIKYRKTDFDKEKDKNKEWCEKNCKPILFGMKQCNPENKTLVVTEGQIDSLSVAESGIENAVSVPTGAKGFTWIPYCWNWIQQFDEIIVFGDHENGTITLMDEFSRRFGKKVKHVKEEDYKDCKDANEILQKYGKDQVRKCIEESIPIPVKHVIDLADVGDIDVFKIQKLQTGIRQLDRLLYGGLPFGGLHVISGKAGEGKSTLASQILINAIHGGYVCFAYSGELPKELFKAWMSFQVAGRSHIFEYQNIYGDSCYNISEMNKRMISEWYRGKMLFYDNSTIEGNEADSLVKTVEEVIQQYGVSVILLDNLMTAMTIESVKGTNLYEQQTDFVNKMRTLAMKYNVLILLVAHKRKNSFGNGDENSEVAGSSNIANLAMLTISYGRGGEGTDDDQRILKVSKNRLFGKINAKGWIMDYDEKSKRIYGEGDDVDFDFEFDKEKKEEDDTPFT